jgi:Cys-rich repeat protein
MRISKQMLVLALGVLGIGTSACATDPGSHTTTKLRHLAVTRADRLLREVTPDDPTGQNGGGIIMPEPGDCPVMSWMETHTVTVDSSGNVISETWQVCTQCYEADGTTPIGDQTCTDEPPVPPMEECTDEPSPDPTLACYVCKDPDGSIIDEECYPLPVACTTDADCPAGQVCYTYDADGGMVPPPRDPNGGTGPVPLPPGDVTGTCGYPDPCVAVPGLPSDPTGFDCWQCTDPQTGEDLGSFCNSHTCAADGRCENPWEQCDPSTNTCVWVDPCQPVDSLPDDPTGRDCYICTYPDQPPMDPSVPPPGDPNGGTGGTITSGYCNEHTCNTDADCANFGEVCDASSGLCIWQDPCVPVPTLPGDPSGSDCYDCKDPMTGTDYGYCNAHACNADADCQNSGYGDTCVAGQCVYTGGGCGDGGMTPPGVPPDGSGGGMQPFAPFAASWIRIHKTPHAPR